MTKTTQKSLLTPMAEMSSRLYRRLFRLLGRHSDEAAEPVRVHADLCLVQAARRAHHAEALALPDTLLQAFSTEPLAAGDARFIGREEQSGRLLAALEMWRSGHGSMVAVTGPQGCGMTSLLQQLSQQVIDNESCRYGKLMRRPYDINDSLALLGEVVGCEQPPVSVDELLDYINGLPPSVFAIDNGHFLACRIMGANEAIRVFGAVMVATQQRHLWVLGCQEYAWRRLVYVYRADRYFADHIELSLFSEPELGQCLATRLQASGFALDPGLAGGNAQLPTPLARHISTFYKLCNGKPDTAFFYFLGSLRVHDGNRQLELQPVVPLDFSILKLLISEELFTLAEVTAHGQLTINDHRALFRCSREESWLMLEHLYRQCLLDKTGTAAEPAYHLVPLYTGVIASHLTNANYLY